jgi:hypothetical protein
MAKDQIYTYVAQIILIFTIFRHYSRFSSAISNVLIRQQNVNKQRGRNLEKPCTLFEKQRVNDSTFFDFDKRRDCTKFSFKPFHLREQKQDFWRVKIFEKITS